VAQEVPAVAQEVPAVRPAPAVAPREVRRAPRAAAPERPETKRMPLVHPSIWIVAGLTRGSLSVGKEATATWEVW
jgi:hypothetical protein